MKYSGVSEIMWDSIVLIILKMIEFIFYPQLGYIFGFILGLLPAKKWSNI